METLRQKWFQHIKTLQRNYDKIQYLLSVSATHDMDLYNRIMVILHRYQVEYHDIFEIYPHEDGGYCENQVPQCFPTFMTFYRGIRDIYQDLGNLDEYVFNLEMESINRPLTAEFYDWQNPEKILLEIVRA